MKVGWRSRTIVALASEMFGSAILASNDLQSWRQFDAGPRYAAGERGNVEHNRTITLNNVEFNAALTADNPLGPHAYRHVDQIWTLRSAGGR